MSGVLPSGAPLEGAREGHSGVRGAAAACVNCHRPSGLGGYEGTLSIPPIIGPYLFRDRQSILGDLGLPHLPGFTPNQLPYDADSLALVIRTGSAPGGRLLSSVMPRYAMDEASMTELVGYLRTLGEAASPGVVGSELEFATIVTPDADPRDSAAMLSVLNAYVAARNSEVSPRVHNARSTGVEYRVSRTWRLHVWKLNGAPVTWQRQLHDRQVAEPVFAVLSGVGRETWSPVHAFCEHDRVPCLFPNVDLPVVSDGDFYPLYYSRGVLLEADLIGSRLAERPRPGSRLVQIYRAGDVGAAAAIELERTARARHWITERRLLDSGSPAVKVRGLLTDLRPQDVLVLWLRSADLEGLGERTPASSIYVSGLMASLEHAPLPTAWRSAIRMTYPFDPPELRRVRMNFPRAWMKSHGVDVSNELLQSNTYLSCTITADAIDTMFDAFLPDFLVERLETLLDRRLSNGFFPRLSLGPGQRFASKGGYVVRLHAGDEVASDGGWVVP